MLFVGIISYTTQSNEAVLITKGEHSVRLNTKATYLLNVVGTDRRPSEADTGVIAWKSEHNILMSSHLTETQRHITTMAHTAELGGEMGLK